MVQRGEEGVGSPIEEEVEAVGSPVEEKIEGVRSPVGEESEGVVLSWLSSSIFSFNLFCMSGVIFCLVLVFYDLL